ncbi:hypothetical protein Cs308_0760 [Candidatus Chlamydia sanziniae]|uniref:Uncharacterized protein n=1 Tax=Candidatus Chlamydia sanziniae TaxID=1806891 RepID=A0A1A9HV99_9CHLA|nr:hypothetical protein Cs308_0760 [Candidatus Chlamydia sanziniae]
MSIVCLLSKKAWVFFFFLMDKFFLFSIHMHKYVMDAAALFHKDENL